MLGKIFACITLSSTVYAIATGRIAALSAAILGGAADAVTVTLGMVGLMCLFGGLMQVLRDVGALRAVSAALRPILRFAFPKSYACEEISAALSANFLGMGNAATPFALAALPQMKDPAHPDAATDDMITFTVLSTAPLSLIPTGILALRSAAACADPSAVLLPIWLVSLLTSLFAVLLCRLFSRLFPLR